MNSSLENGGNNPHEERTNLLAFMSTPLVKVVVAGDGNVGKTSLIRRYTEDKFDISRVATIGVDFHTHSVNLPDRQVRLSIWDMAGQDRFRVMRPGFYKGSRAAALVFDITNPESLEHLLGWREEILEIVPDQNFVVVANKIDLDRTQNPEIAHRFAKLIHAPYIETSALTGKGVTTMFKLLAQIATTSNQGKA